MKKPRVIEVIWEDAHSNGHSETWGDWSEWKKDIKPRLCHSLGYVVQETETLLAIAGSVNYNEDESDFSQVSGTLVIPRAMVRKIRTLR